MNTLTATIRAIDRDPAPPRKISTVILKMPVSVV